MSKENQKWLHDLFISEAKAAKDYHNRGGGDGGEAIPTQEKTVDITQNGMFVVEPDEGHTISKVMANVNVPSEEPTLEELIVTANGEYTPSGDGFSKVIVNVVAAISQLTTPTIEIYTAN